jgi:hypothetical protein
VPLTVRGPWGSLSATLRLVGHERRGELALCGEADGTPFAVVVPLEAVPCRFGGVRWWARCDGCDRRCGRLVGRPVAAPWRCWRCARVAYASTREQPLERALRRLCALRRRLGDEHADPTRPLPPKPPRMRRATWRALRAEVAEAERRADALLVSATDHLR